ncbi:MAG: hypothetical protein KUG82_03640 [Pseudomonadales bacterium]|nr:hypothetical protein [Pseudomonadales bacterium]
MNLIKKSICSCVKNVVLALGVVGALITQSMGVSVDIGQRHNPISIQKKSIFPESIWLNESNGRFIVGSFFDGKVYEIDEKGSTSVLVDDVRLNSVLGIAVDQKRRRLYVANSDIGVSMRSNFQHPKKLAALGVYELDTGKVIDYVDLGGLLPETSHLANGVAIDDMGNAYITDSFSPVIYKVDLEGKASIFSRSREFEGTGINLNGIAFHPDGYLLVIKKSDGVLFKVSIKNPKLIQRVNLSTKMVGGDGVLLVDNNHMLVVANSASGIKSNSVFSITTDNSWDSAKIVKIHKLDDVYPTTAVIKGDDIYVIHTSLNRLIGSKKKDRASLNYSGSILKIGSVEY